MISSNPISNHSEGFTPCKSDKALLEIQFRYGNPFKILFVEMEVLYVFSKCPSIKFLMLLVTNQCSAPRGQ